MKKKLTLWILLLPTALFAQVEMKDGAISIPLGKKKDKTVQQDTTQAEDNSVYDDEEDQPKPVKKKKLIVEQPEEAPNFKRDGLFKGIFHVGINACQIDGDNYAGYKYAGLDAGVGVMVRFHKYFSTSLELNYSMKGAKQAYRFQEAPQTLQKYRVQWDYIEAPLALNVHDKKLVMFSLGIVPGYMVRLNQRDEQGNQVSVDTVKGGIFSEPRRFSLEGFGALHFFIKQQFGFGVKFSYSILKIRGSGAFSKANGQYNNVLTFRFTYILDPARIGKNRKRS